MAWRIWWPSSASTATFSLRSESCISLSSGFRSWDVHFPFLKEKHETASRPDCRQNKILLCAGLLWRGSRGLKALVFTHTSSCGKKKSNWSKTTRVPTSNIFQEKEWKQNVLEQEVVHKVPAGRIWQVPRHLMCTVTHHMSQKAPDFQHPLQPRCLTKILPQLHLIRRLTFRWWIYQRVTSLFRGCHLDWKHENQNNLVFSCQLVTMNCAWPIDFLG